VTSVHRINARKDIQIAVRLWQLIIVYELKPYDLDKHIQAAYKYFVRNGHYFDAEKQILKGFRDLYKARIRDEKESVWQGIIDFVDEKSKEGKILQRGLNYLQIWCKSKISRKSIFEVAKEYKVAPIN